MKVLRLSTVVLLATSLLVTSAGCEPPAPRLVVPERSRVKLTVRVIDIDPLVVKDCERAVAGALLRHGFLLLDEAGTTAQRPLNARVDVTFPDGFSADINGTVDVSVPPQTVMASSSVGYFDLPVADLRSRGARYRTQSCANAAERFADEMVNRLGHAPRLAGAPPEPATTAPAEEDINAP